MSHKITDNSPAPKVYVYPASKLQLNQKQVLVCQARDIPPDLVNFIWQARDQSGKEVELKDEETLEQISESQGIKTSMLIVDKEKVKTNTFTCSFYYEEKLFTKSISAAQQQGNAPLLFY